ncbi:patatin-like phospholipase family protein [Amnibacterium setariae]|uniref:Patatin-like phospholipase family protein n=1 Tax=Amnibacterium setariae TaxID=2306585 RepID=A0A3A1TW92_9MICO|nr:patatin-like phospholipase family protein [Amnibacterium setariae]RIX27821.1 patatin-like phospholipase family protein [Amnibacterium setariae]
MRTTSSTTSSTSSPTPSRALVLGGGGSAGNAWLIGVLAGLADAGLDVTDADLVVGTSAGATAAVQIVNEPLPDLLSAILDGQPAPPPATTSAANATRPRGPESDLLERTARVIAASSDAADMRRRIGALFLELADPSDGISPNPSTERWRGVVAARLPGHRWPATRVLLTAVDATTGEQIVFDRDSGVDLVDAVAASTSGGAAYRVGDRWCIDGGYRRNENADLAAGAARVLVLSPFSGRTRHPLAWGMQLAAQVEELRAAGSRIETIIPDADAAAAFGGGMMDPAARPPAARAGFAQGRREAERLAPFWRG